MTRGNQRELARERNLKKQKELKKSQGSNNGIKLEKRMETDADIMRRKQQEAAAKKAADAAKTTEGKKLQHYDPLK